MPNTTLRMIPAEGSRDPKSVSRLTIGRGLPRTILAAAGVVIVLVKVRIIGTAWYATFRARYPAPPMVAPHQVSTASNPRSSRVAGPAWQRLIGLRLIAASLVGLWAGLALIIVLSYRPGGPWDTVVAAAAFLPIPIAAVAVIWPPLVRPWRAAAAIAWLGIIAMLLSAPLVLVVINSVAAGGHQTLLPSPEVAYAGLLALATLCLFSALGIVAGRRARDVTTRGGLLHATGLAVLLTAVSGLTLGGAAVANELALRDVAPASSRFGPTDPELTIPTCDVPPLVGSGATLEVRADATVDQSPIGSSRLNGIRSGADERWSGWLDSRYDDGVAEYTRVDTQAWLDQGRGMVPTAPDPFGMPGPRQLTVDGPVAAALGLTRPRPVAEDLGIEVVEGARARHCRTAVDGPTALELFLPLRWLAGGDVVNVTRPLENWRGTLDWWTFADGELGQASATISGYPGEAWPTTGIQGQISARMTATNRTVPHVVTPEDVP
jgi:hypothetical protein